MKRVGREQRGHMRCRRRRWRRDSRFRRGHVPTPMVARSVCASRCGTLDSHELVTSGVALHWALACETRRRTCSGRRCSSGRLVRRHEPSGRVRPRGPGKRGHRGHTMRADARGFGLRSPIIVAIATSLERGVNLPVDRGWRQDTIASRAKLLVSTQIACRQRQAERRLNPILYFEPKL